VPRAVTLICVETQSTDEVMAAEARLAAADLETTGLDDTQCCYAQKTATRPSGPRRHQLGVVRQDRRQRTARQPGRHPDQRRLLPRLTPRSSPARRNRPSRRRGPAVSGQLNLPGGGQGLPRDGQHGGVRPRPGVAYRRRPPPGVPGHSGAVHERRDGTPLSRTWRLVVPPFGFASRLEHRFRVRVQCSPWRRRFVLVLSGGGTRRWRG
jgi:hypothetical protein